jgi:hypothetical protein
LFFILKIDGTVINFANGCNNHDGDNTSAASRPQNLREDISAQKLQGTCKIIENTNFLNVARSGSIPQSASF